MLSSISKSFLKCNTRRIQAVCLFPKSHQFSVLAMDLELPGIPLSHPISISQPQTKTETLSNGVKIICTETAGQGSSATIFVRAGSRNESLAEYGSAMMLKTMAFHQTTYRSDLKLARDLEDAGASVSASSGREFVSYTAAFPPESLETSLTALSETVLFPKMRSWEVDELKKTNDTEIKAALKSPSNVLSELIHAAAYGEESPLGHNFYSQNANISGDSLLKYHSKTFVGSNLIVVGVNVDFKQFVGQVEKQFSGAPTGVFVSPPSPYTGGEIRLKADSPYTYLGLAYQVANPEIASVVKAILDLKLKTSSFSTASFSSSYNKTSLVGVCGVCHPARASALLDFVKSNLNSLSSVSDTEMSIALNAEKISTAMKLESSKSAPLQLVSGVCKSATAVDVKSEVQKILSSPLTVASLGDLSSLPRV